MSSEAVDKIAKAVNRYFGTNSKEVISGTVARWNTENDLASFPIHEWDPLLWLYSNNRASSAVCIREGASPELAISSLRGDAFLTSVRRMFADGYTIILNEVDLVSYPTYDLCNRMGQLFGARCSANLYITPRRSQGFNTHSDPQDIIILQLAGQKTWCFPDANVTKKVEAGELMFVRPMTAHFASTEDVPSVHLTLAIEIAQVSDVIDILVERVRNSSEEIAGMPYQWAPLFFPGVLQRLQKDMEDALHLAKLKSDVQPFDGAAKDRPLTIRELLGHRV